MKKVNHAAAVLTLALTASTVLVGCGTEDSGRTAAIGAEALATPATASAATSVPGPADATMMIDWWVGAGSIARCPFSPLGSGQVQEATATMSPDRTSISMPFAKVDRLGRDLGTPFGAQTAYDGKRAMSAVCRGFVRVTVPKGWSVTQPTSSVSGSALLRAGLATFTTITYNAKPDSIQINNPATFPHQTATLDSARLKGGGEWAPFKVSLPASTRYLAQATCTSTQLKASVLDFSFATWVTIDHGTYRDAINYNRPAGAAPFTQTFDLVWKKC